MGQPVPPDGVLVLGQDQDSLGGGFSARDPHRLPPVGPGTEPPASAQSSCLSATPGGLLFQWDPEALNVTPTLLPTVLLSLLCPGRTSAPTAQMLCPSPGWPIESSPAPV